MKDRSPDRRRAGLLALTCALSLLGAAAHGTSERLVQVSGGSEPRFLTGRPLALGSVAGDADVTFSVSLPWRNQGDLTALLKRLYDPKDSLYHHFLKPSEFAARFAPTQSDYEAVQTWARTNGMQVTGTTPNRHLLQLSGTAVAVGAALHVRFERYMTPRGREFRAPSQDPQVEASIARRIVGFSGLSTAARWHSNFTGAAQANTIGSGPYGGLTPSDIRAAYGLSGVSETGAGQTLAVLELATYAASDIDTYASYFSLTAPTLSNVTIGTGADGTDTNGIIEATLDIELLAALAPGTSSIQVYEAPNTDSGVLAAYNQIATDGAAAQVSTSWGLDEASAGSSFLTSENQIFEQYAAQGQNLFASAGDYGAYDNGSTLSVDDPASQPYVTGVGGTSLTTASAGGAWSSETTWNGGSITNGAGGGGYSAYWTAPSYQSSVSTGITSRRIVPDVSFDADPDTGYAIYVNGQWEVYGGTSCASPLWTAFHALVNQRRVTDGLASLGFANDELYTIYAGSDYDSAFHDIADGSTNLYYSAVTGYDPATGLGTPQGETLLGLLATDSTTTTGSAPAAPTNLAAAGGVGQIVLTWTASTGATSYNVYRMASTDSAFTEIGTATSASYTDKSVSYGVTYAYMVTAVNAYGESGDSNEVTAASTTSGSTAFAAGINFFSLPYSYSGTSLDTIFGYSGVTLYVYDPVEEAYVTTPTAPADTITPGRGYWAKFPTVVNAASGTAVDTTQDYSISLTAGWNQIGDPFTASVAVSALEVEYSGTTYPFSAAASQYGLINGTLYRYDPSTAAYVTVGSTVSLVPDLGYWIYAAYPVTLIVPHP